MNNIKIKKYLLGIVAFILYAVSPARSQTLIVEAKPAFSDTAFVQNNNYQYLLAEIQDIRTYGTQFDRVNSNAAQYQTFYYIRPSGYIECTVTIPVSGNYNIYTRLYQYGNSAPKAGVYVDGIYKNEITGSQIWAKTTVNLNAGSRTIRYEESGTGSTDWPLRLVGFDAVAITNDPIWTPPTDLSTHPYTGNQYWWQRPSQQLAQIDVSVGGKIATFTGQWNYTDILLIDSTGASQGTANNFTASGDSLAGENLDNAAVSANTARRTHSTALLTTRTKNRISPNYDMIDDEVSVIVPQGQSGYLKIKKYDDSTIRQLPNENYIWDGRLSNDIYSDFAAKRGYLLEFIPTSGGSAPLLACVYSEPDKPSMVWPRVREISPNGDSVYDNADVYLNTSAGFHFNTSDTVIVRDGLGAVIKNLSKTNPVNWNGTYNSGDVCPAGTYTIEILDGASQLRAAAKINILDLPPIDDQPYNPDFYVLGMWMGFNSTSSADLDNIVSMNCNAIRHPGSGTNISGSTRIASSWWPTVESRNLKSLVNLYEVVQLILDMQISPSEPHLEALLSPYVNPIKNRTGLLGYELIDEPKYTAEKGYRMRAIQQVLHKLDPAHPSVPVLIGYDSRISGYTADMKPHQLLLDVYPCNLYTQPGDFRNIWNYQNLEMMQYMDWAMAFVEPRNVPTWIIHQSHNFQDSLREPYPAEIGLQVWLGLTRAITGSFFFIYETQQDWTGLKDNPLLKTALTNIYGRLKLPAIYNVLPHLRKDSFNVSITGGGNPSGYVAGDAKPLTDGTKKYVIAANRNCTSSSAISLNSVDYPTAKLKDLETGIEYQMGQSITFLAGDGKIFELGIEELTPPDVPTNLSFTDITETQLRLNWQPPAGDCPVIGYYIYDGADNSFLQELTSTNFLFTDLTPGRNYSFYVKAYNNIGTSPPSETAEQTVFFSESPTMPDDVRVTGYGATQIQLVWDSSQDNVAVQDYDVFRNQQLIDTVTGTTYNFTDCLPQTRYEFQVRARDVDSGLSDLTEPICAVTRQTDGSPTELAGHWKFDESSGLMADDSSIYGRDGLISNAVWATGYYDGALNFNGSTSKVDIGTFDVTGNQLTIAAWVKANAFNFAGDNRIVSKAAGTAEADHYWMLSTRRMGSEYFLRFRLKTDGITHTLQGASQTISIGQWTHLCATYDGSTMRLYKNGVLDSETLSKYGDIDSDTLVKAAIGANPDDGIVWNGDIDDVRIYSAALSPVQIQEVMNGDEPLPALNTTDESCSRLVDFNCDCTVDMIDFGFIARYWSHDTFPGLGDIDENDIVDFQDLAELMSEWLIED
ncbi:MAG: hypothetical protein A2Y10_17840 [Planctomycetes bacterium GWF2_41_51]|nr:MAG: hypothetical protein A2Y10_17840 [Planctomycetes bacterium GWF2_41_51]HBG25885.1 hypothetical protein [Phycisphaerales bacterium]